MNKTLVAFTLLIATSFAAITTNTDLSTTLSSSSGIYLYGATSDFIGNSISNAGDFNKDGVQDFLIGTAQNKAYLVFGTSSARSAALDLAASSNAATSVLKFTFTSTGNKLPATFSVVVSAAGDLDKDGYDDVAFGIPSLIGTKAGPADQADSGAVLVYYGISNTAITALGSATISLDPATGASSSMTKYFWIKDASTAAVAGKFGTAIASGGDVFKDSNNVDDLVIGKPADSTGFVYILKGTAAKRQADVDFSSFAGAGIILTGTATSAVGTSVAGLGDVNGDGNDDVILGAPGANAAWIVYGSSGLVDQTLATTGATSGTLTTYVPSPTANILFGQNVASPGDINNDGANDILIGAPKSTSSAGKVYIIPGIKTGARIADLTTSTIANQIVISGPTTGYLGWASDGGEDINLDGIDDLITCAPGLDLTVGSPTYTAITGKCYVMYGKTSFPSVDLSSTTLSTTSSPVGFTITGVAAKGFGTDVSVVMDVSGDSGNDFIISATQATGGSATSGGNVFLFYGVAPTTTTTGSGVRLGASLLVFVSFFATLMF